MVKSHLSNFKKNDPMSQILFPKPPPAKPLPQESWLKLTDRSEVGREPFFHGRDAEYEVFQSAIYSLHEGFIGGGTMIFQGAPGAGKSALMLECMTAVRQHSTPQAPWVAVSLNPGTLKSPVDVVKDLIHAANQESKRLSKLAPDAVARQLNKWLELGVNLYQELSNRGIGVAGFSVGGKSETGSRAEMTLSSGPVFRDAAAVLGKFRVVVFVDEAQNSPVGETTRDVLDCLHRDPQGIPLVAAFFGLSDTQQVLRECGLSRFADERLVNLEPLSIEDAAGSIRRMLDTYFTGSDEEKTNWSTALAELSQGWPQHINRTGVAAGRVIRENNGRLDKHLLEQALAKGVERKNDYYAGRLAAVSNPPWVYKQLALAAAKKEGALAGIVSYDEVYLLTEAARMRSEETIKEFLTNALHAGLLAPVNELPFHYQFPIPSLGDYLRELPVELPNSVE